MQNIKSLNALYNDTVNSLTEPGVESLQNKNAWIIRMIAPEEWDTCGLMLENPTGVCL